MTDVCKFFLVSYVPGLSGEAGETIDEERVMEIGRQIDEADNSIDGVVWVGGPDGPAAVLLRRDGVECASHLKRWAEGKPEDWFTVALAESGELYGLVLMPNVQEGVRRFRVAYQLRTGYPLPEDTDFRVLFKPLTFVSRPGHVFGQVRPALGDRIRVLMMNVSDFKGPDTDVDLAVDLGDLPLETEGRNAEWVVERLEDSVREGNDE